LDLNIFQSLLTSTGQAALQAAMDLEPREADFLRCLTNLNRRFEVELAKAALEITILRREAASKFPQAHQMYFSRPALEQATAFEVSEYRSLRFRNFSVLVDLGCSIGGDTLALAAQAPTLGIDLDPLRLAMARENLRVSGGLRQALLVQADLLQPLPLPASGQTGLFFDPARRTGQRRLFSVEKYQPPLSIVKSWLAAFPALGVKISPGVKLNEISSYDAEVEFISLNGELKEAVMWFGPLRSARRRATLLPGPHTLFSDDRGLERLPVQEPRAYLYEPDPAVLRAGLVATVGHIIGGSQLDPEIAYLTADADLPTPFARSWKVETWFPFGLKRLRAYLREREVGEVVVKKRGSPLEPEALIRDLRLKGPESRVVFLTQLKGRPIIIVCYPFVSSK
jgi:hypothetical protein